MRISAPVSLNLPNTLAVLRPVRAFVREILHAQGFDKRETEEVEVALEEAVVNVVEHAYEPGAEATFRLTVAPVPLGIRLVVHDDGLPLDADAMEREIGNPSSPGLGVGHLLMRRLVDEFTLVNRGRGGKDVEMVKYFHRHPSGEPEEGSCVAERRAGGTERSPEGEGVSGRKVPVTIRPFEPRDALEIARCAWYAYGYTYAHDHVFFPQRMVELNAQGELLSLVAATSGGEIAGHCAAKFAAKDAPTAEIGMAFVKPAFSSRGLLKALSAALIRMCRERGLSSVSVQAVTSHVASQKAAMASGFFPGALLVGAYGENYDFKTMGGLCEGRLSLLLGLQCLEERAPFLHFVPDRHRHMVSRLYEGFGMAPPLAESSPSPLPEHGEISLRVVEADNAASVEVRSVGRDGAPHLTHLTRTLCHRRVDHIRLALPLGDPGTPELCRAMEAQGYFFAGIFLGGPREDLLLLQYLNNVVRYYQKIQVFGPVAQELLSYVRECDPYGRE